MSDGGFDLLTRVNLVATTLGFATTLLATSLPIAECKRHVLLYTAARPLAVLLSYSATTLSGIVPSDDRPLMFVLNAFTVSPAASLLPMPSIRLPQAVAPAHWWIYY